MEVAQKVAKKLEDYDDDNLESLAKIRPHYCVAFSVRSFVPSFVSGKRNWRVLRWEEDKGISQRSGKMAAESLSFPSSQPQHFLGGIQSVSAYCKPVLVLC